MWKIIILTYPLIVTAIDLSCLIDILQKAPGYKFWGLKIIFGFRDDFDRLLPEPISQGSQDESQPLELVQALDVFRVACRLFLIFKQQRDKKRFEKLCKYIVQSLHSESVKISYVGVFLNKEYRYDIKGFVFMAITCIKLSCQLGNYWWWTISVEQLKKSPRENWYILCCQIVLVTIKRVWWEALLILLESNSMSL